MPKLGRRRPNFSNYLCHLFFVLIPIDYYDRSMEKFTKENLEDLYTPAKDSYGEQNGQVTIIGGSTLFHGAPIFGLKVASRMVDMVFFATPEKSVGRIAELAKSKLMSFIWVPWEECEEYIEKSDSILIGPGFMRYRSEKVPHGERYHLCDISCKMTSEITQRFLTKFPNKKWVIDAGSLQTMEVSWIPKNAVLTPNKHEFKYLFGEMDPAEAAEKHKCIIVRKGPVTRVYGDGRICEIEGGNAGLTKGGTGDTQAGLTAAFLAKNDPFLSACAASFVIKHTADKLYKKVGTNFNSDDLADNIPSVFFNLLK